MCRREIKETLPKSLQCYLYFAPKPIKKSTLDFTDLDEFPPLE